MDATSQRLKRVGREGKADLVQAEKQGELLLSLLLSLLVVVVVVAAVEEGRWWWWPWTIAGPGAEPELSQRQQNEVTQEPQAREEKSDAGLVSERAGYQFLLQWRWRLAESVGLGVVGGGRSSSEDLVI